MALDKDNVARQIAASLQSLTTGAITGENIRNSVTNLVIVDLTKTLAEIQADGIEGLLPNTFIVLQAIDGYALFDVDEDLLLHKIVGGTSQIEGILVQEPLTIDNTDPTNPVLGSFALNPDVYDPTTVEGDVFDLANMSGNFAQTLVPDTPNTRLLYTSDAADE